MLFKVLFSVAVLLELIFVPLFLKAMWPKKNRLSLMYKMICSGSFMLMAFCAMEMGKGYSRYALLMILGAFFGLLGDYFLHAKGTTLYFIFGLSSFLIGHVFYIAAFSVVLLRDFTEYSYFNFPEIMLFAAVFGIALFLAFKYKLKFRPKALVIGVVLYAVTIILMFVKAVTLGLFSFAYQLEFRIPVLILLSLGSLSFVLSDSTLGIILFGGEKGNYPLKIFNIVTYFAAQMLLASTLIFIS